ncbi:MAG TPA: PKD domain-containing protein, partial [Saprospiraceae bacterium]|nr:PKD domain-containing protein [Saprospiraceae bacterium]
TNDICGDITERYPVRVSAIPELSLAPIGDACGRIDLSPELTIDNLEDSFVDSVRWVITNGSGAVVYAFTGMEPSTFSPTNIEIEGVDNYMVSVVAFNGCGMSMPVEQSFRLQEAPMIIAQVDSFLCVDEALTITNNSTGDFSAITWNVNPMTGVALSDESDSVPSISFSMIGDYEVTLTLTNVVCGDISSTYNVQVSAPPALSLDPIPDFCQEGVITPIYGYGIPEALIDSVEWRLTYENDSLLFVSNAINVQEIPFSGPAGSYTLSLWAENSCGIDEDSVRFMVDTVPDIILGPTDTICITEGIFQMPTPIPIGGTWRDSLGRTGVMTPEGLFDPLAAGGGIQVVEYVFDAAACGEIVTSKEIFVVDLRNDVSGGEDIDVCVSEDSIQLTGGMPGGGWYIGEGVADSSGLFLPSSVGVGAYTVTYFYQFPGTDCIFSDDLIVNVRPLPVAETGRLDSLCINTPVRLPNTSMGGENFVWRINGEQLYTTAEPIHSFLDTGFATLQLLAISPFGCLDSTEVEVYVSGPPIARFAMDTTQGCAVLPITFDNQSIPFEYFQYDWDFGNGVRSTLPEPGTIRFDQGFEDTTYYVGLIVSNHCGIDIAVDSVTVFPKPIPRPILSNNFGCTPLDVEFNNLSRGLPEAYFWDLGNGVTSTDSIPPNQIYEAPDSVNVIYPITLMATNECGDSSVTQEILVKPEFIRAFFSASVNEGCEPLEVTFSNSTNPDSAIIYSWDFGDGNTSQSEDTTYTFMARGDSITTYTVTLLADNGCAQDEISLDIKVFPAPVVDFEVTPVACANDTTRFFNRSVDVSANIWEFGDGDTSLLANPIHIYEEPGIYTVRLTSFSRTTGCPNTMERTIEIREIPSLDFEVENLFGCPPHRIDLVNRTQDASYFEWDFGDGNSTVGREVPQGHTYTESGFYSVTLIATDEFACKNDSTFSFVQVYPVPEIDFSIDFSPECGLPSIACIDNQTIGAAAYDWDFGNGQSSTETQPCVDYSDAGTYDITLVARNEFLCEETLTQPLTVYDIPMALFDTNPRESCVGATLRLSNESSHTEAEFTQWYVNGILYSTGVDDLVYTFRDTGYYDVKLIVGNGSGCRDSLSVNELVRVFPSPTAGFSFNKLEAERPTTIQFYDESSDDVVGWNWDFDDGTGSGEENPVKRFLSRFEKEVELVVSNTFACTDTAVQTVQLDTLSGLFIPNTLEPNHPDKGKAEFLPQGIGLSDFHIAIYTRQGQLVWESTSLNEEGMPDEAWRGNFNGVPLPNGVFVWQVIEARFLDGDVWDGMADERERLRKTGFVRLLR